MLFNQEELAEGKILTFNKPYGWTSFQLVKKIKYLTKAKKIGHAGTLDPLATGVLVLCTGKATKKIEAIQLLPKTYTGIIKLGATTPCFDLEQEIDQTYPTDHINLNLIKEKVSLFTGAINQTPPAFSAVKVKGERAYKLAREGKTPEIKSKQVEVYSFEITDFKNLELYFRIKCSKGTYIRSIARDLGYALQSGAHLTKLERTEIGEYSLKQAYTVEQFTTANASN